MKEDFTGLLIPDASVLANCYYSNDTTNWFFYSEIWQKQVGTVPLPCRMTRLAQKRTHIPNQQCTVGLPVNTLLPFGLPNNSVSVALNTLFISLDTNRMEVKGAILSSSDSNRMSLSNGDVSLFLASGGLTLKEKIQFSSWVSIRDNYLLKIDRFYTMDKVRREYSFLSENGLNLVKVANNVPSYYDIENLDVFNDGSLTGKYPKNVYIGKCSTIMSTLKIVLGTGAVL
jgi:hypothetical protein